MKESNENKGNTDSAEHFKKQIEGATKVNFGISSCPLPLYEEFKLVCKTDFADTYHLALRYLLDLYKGTRELDNVWEVIHKLASRIEELEMKQTIKVEETKRPEIKTFGQNNEGKE